MSLLPIDSEYAVFELGMSHAGELDKLSKLLQPHIALILNVYGVHSSNFSSINDIAFAKSEIINGINKKMGAVVLNCDSPYFNTFFQQSLKKGIEYMSTFGENKNSIFKLLSIERYKSGMKVFYLYEGNTFNFFLPVYGKTWALHCLSVLATINLFRLPFDSAAKLFTKMKFLPGRGKIYKVNFNKGNVFIVDDTYSASPITMNLSFERFYNWQEKYIKRKILILGDMLELKEIRKEHENLLAGIMNYNFDKVYTCGNYMKYLFNCLPSNIKGKHFVSSYLASISIKEFLRPGDAILIKGSHGTSELRGQMSVILDGLLI